MLMVLITILKKQVYFISDLIFICATQLLVGMHLMLEVWDILCPLHHSMFAYDVLQTLHA